MNYGNYNEITTLQKEQGKSGSVSQPKRGEKAEDCAFIRRVNSAAENILPMKKLNAMNYGDCLMYVTALNRRRYKGMSKEWGN